MLKLSGTFSFSWSCTKIQLVQARMSLNFIIFKFWNRGLVGSFFGLKEIILMAFSWIYSIFLIVWFLCWSQACIAYLKMESKIAKYTFLNRSVLAKYLNFARRPQPRLNLLFIWSNWKFHVRFVQVDSWVFNLFHNIYFFAHLF